MTSPTRRAPRHRSTVAADPGPGAGRERIAGVDAARAVALVGMFATHILPLRTSEGTATTTGLLADGRASALFAVLAGVGVALSTGGTRPPASGRSHLAAATGLVVRGVLVGMLGLLLVELSPPVAVILAYYGLLFMLATPVLRWSAGALAAAAALACAATPVLSHVLRTGGPGGPGEQPGLGALAEPVDLLETLALTGYYPVLAWTTYLLAGMAVGRLDLRRRGVAAALLGGGAALAVLASVASAILLAAGGAGAIGADEDRHHGSTPTDTWWWLAVDTPHSGTPFDLAHTTGTALAVLGAMLLLARWVPQLVRVPAAVGAIPLTLYTLHVVAVEIHPGRGPAGGWVWLAHVLAAVLIGVLLRLVRRRGPLEWAVSGVSRAARRAVGVPDRDVVPALTPGRRHTGPGARR